jgi:two-component system response regulator DevR
MLVIIVTGHPRVRQNLGRLLRREPAIDTVVEAESMWDAVAHVSVNAPDVAVIDLRLPAGTGLDACREIRSIAPSTRVILLAGFIDEALQRRAVEAGAAALLLKEPDPSALLAEIRKHAMHSSGSVVD